MQGGVGTGAFRKEWHILWRREWTTGTLTHWTKYNSESYYFTSLVYEGVRSHRLSKSILVLLVEGRAPSGETEQRGLRSRVIAGERRIVVFIGLFI
ncbi:hypothetical protein EVAR_32374_1 [Eumeta japonica]|uniref:Uncharacterized protein n=1 Tax=Eumeta variegata TaxID=151549 RepID=A0A4C1VID7_EUMVA|nr:hypothetical protein EVAR_32374_1 [Eumeta japonica]